MVFDAVNKGIKQSCKSHLHFDNCGQPNVPPYSIA